MRRISGADLLRAFASGLKQRTSRGVECQTREEGGGPKNKDDASGSQILVFVLEISLAGVGQLRDSISHRRKLPAVRAFCQM